MKKSKQEKKTIYDLELHETILTKFGIVIMRVAGGWLYDCWDTKFDNFKKGIFVPYNNEFLKKISIIEILEITDNFFRNKVISRTILFSDDTSIDIDREDNSIIDMEGMFNVPSEKIKMIENKLNIKIKL